MDISSRFSLNDFLAYLFPGVLASTGFFLLLLLTPLDKTLLSVPTDITTGVLFLVYSYIIGVVLSGFPEILLRSRRLRQKGSFPFPEFENDIRKAFKDVFGTKENIEWTRSQFYLCRSLVYEFMPNAVQVIQRQNNLRQLRLNMLPSIFIWFGVGIGWGLKIASSGFRGWGIGIIIITIVLAILITFVTINRMRNNDEREARETYSAFLAGHRAGLFSKEHLPKSKAPSQI